jgi:hypothetical protein
MPAGKYLSRVFLVHNGLNNGINYPHYFFNFHPRCGKTVDFGSGTAKIHGPDCSTHGDTVNCGYVKENTLAYEGTKFCI